MTKKELCRISHLLFILDTYLFQEPGREDLCREIAELQKAIGEALKDIPT
ncbi:hypothetical protein [Lawsonibacter sp. JLR.KK007]